MRMLEHQEPEAGPFMLSITAHFPSKAAAEAHVEADRAILGHAEAEIDVIEAPPGAEWQVVRTVVKAASVEDAKSIFSLLPISRLLNFEDVATLVPMSAGMEPRS